MQPGPGSNYGEGEEWPEQGAEMLKAEMTGFADGLHGGCEKERKWEMVPGFWLEQPSK